MEATVLPGLRSLCSATMRLAAIGDRDPSYLTHRELDAAFALMDDTIDCGWTPSDSREARDLDDVGGVWLLPGTPYRDDSAAYAAIDYCLETETPFLGTCGGFQYACIALARKLAGLSEAAHAENDPGAEMIVVAPLACSLYGERRMVEPVVGTRLAQLCGERPFVGFHWCGFGLDPTMESRLEGAGVVLSARAEDAGVEAIELSDHPFFIATAFQPQMGASEARQLHPLITALIDSGRRRQVARTTSV
ncbi:MAG: glutamine amidotransferase-related protein [Solirubrobacteraceae bacterium]